MTTQGVMMICQLPVVVYNVPQSTRLYLRRYIQEGGFSRMVLGQVNSLDFYDFDFYLQSDVCYISDVKFLC